MGPTTQARLPFTFAHLRQPTVEVEAVEVEEAKLPEVKNKLVITKKPKAPRKKAAKKKAPFKSHAAKPKGYSKWHREIQFMWNTGAFDTPERAQLL